MRTFLTAAAVATLMCGSASAAWYVTGEGADRIVVNSEDNSQSPLLMGEGDAAPSNCPAGQFYENGQHMIVACEGGAIFSMMEPEAGTMMENGEPFPEGARLLNSEQNATGAEDGQSDAATGTEPAN